MKVRLKKILSNHNRLRTDVIEGDLAFIPVIGEIIYIIAKPLDSTQDFRKLTTSPVKKIEGNRYFTQNSVYELEILE